MSLEIIYAPKGPAQEYAEINQGDGNGLAVNLYKGCTHGCKYCYVPSTTYWRVQGGDLRTRTMRFHADRVARPEALDMFTRDCEKLQAEDSKSPIFMSFTCDPYQYGTESDDLTRQALLVASKYGRRISLLTKAGSVGRQDLDLFAQHRDDLIWEYGVSLVFRAGLQRSKWEPNAAPYRERWHALRDAHERGCRTWVSLEPVINPEQTLAIIRETRDIVGHYKIGKINGHDQHTKAIERAIDWHDFRRQVKETCDEGSYTLKKSLLEATADMG